MNYIRSIIDYNDDNNRIKELCSIYISYHFIPCITFYLFDSISLITFQLCLHYILYGNSC